MRHLKSAHDLSVSEAPQDALRRIFNYLLGELEPVVRQLEREYQEEYREVKTNVPSYFPM